jgi:hypothetical protein
MSVSGFTKRAGVLFSGSLILGLGVAVPAWAAGSGGFGTLAPTGASFTNGQWSFDPWPCNSSCVAGEYSGWNYSGTLKDTAADGDYVYTQGKTDGYDWAIPRDEYHGGVGSVFVSQDITDPDGDPAEQGQLQVCRERNNLPDDCVHSSWKYR